MRLAARFDDSVLPLAFLTAKTRPETAKYAPRAAAAEPALASDPFPQKPATMRPLLQRRAAARLAAGAALDFEFVRGFVA